MNVLSRFFRLRYLIPLALIVLVAGAGVWYSSALGAAGTGTRIEIVKPGSGSRQIADQLARDKVIKSSTAFQWHVRLNHLAPNFKSGRFVLSGKRTASEIASDLTQTPANNRITIKEGQTQSEIADVLAAQDVVKKNDFAKLRAADFNYGFLQGLPKNARLEGFLFPDTYQLPLTDATPSNVADIFLKEFDNKLSADLRAQIKKSGHTTFEAVTVASIVEKEVRSEVDRRLVAGIMYKRLAQGIPLGADATVHYAVEKPFTENLTRDDLDSDNPYNTRKFKGLPPGPICNPGLASLEAAANPQDSDYLFYISDPKTGKTIFAKTNDEQNANIQKYLR